MKSFNNKEIENKWVFETGDKLTCYAIFKNNKLASLGDH